MQAMVRQASKCRQKPDTPSPAERCTHLGYTRSDVAANFLATCEQSPLNTFFCACP